MSADLTVGYCHPGTVSAAFMESMLDLTLGRAIDAWIGIEGGPRIATSRNNIVRTFLDQRSAPYLLMVDTDMSFGIAEVNAIVKRAKTVPGSIVGGLCFTGGSQIQPTLYAFTEGEGMTVTPVWNYPPDELCQVDATGAAFILIPRNVLEVMRDKYESLTAYPWFADSERDGKEIGEDVTFCLRARSCGFPVYVDTAIRVGHRKARTLDQDTYLQWRREYTKAHEHELGDKGEWLVDA